MNITKNILTVNFSAGRADRAIDAIVVHVMEGTMEGTRSWFRHDPSNVSAHYGISKKGEIEQWVEEDDRAYHAGRVKNPTAALVLEREGVNPNLYTIGIEHEGAGDSDLTDDQRVASAWLIADICRRRNIPIDSRHIFGHHAVFSAKSCPGAIDVPRLIRAASPEIAPATFDSRPRVVWSKFFGDWLVTTKIVSDKEWYFVPLKSLPAGTRAATPLSQLPLTR